MASTVLTLHPSLAQETKLSASAAWDSFYGYTFFDKDYKHRDHRQHFINLFEVNLGAEKDFDNDWSLGIYADLYRLQFKNSEEYIANIDIG